jgi:hypothetical protein
MPSFGGRSPDGRAGAGVRARPAQPRNLGLVVPYSPAADLLEGRCLQLPCHLKRRKRLSSMQSVDASRTTWIKKKE